MAYEKYELGQLAVVRKTDGALIGRCGLSDVAVESRIAEGRALPRGWFSRSQAPKDIELEFEPELGYTFGREFWGYGFIRRTYDPFGWLKDLVFDRTAASKCLGAH